MNVQEPRKVWKVLARGGAAVTLLLLSLWAFYWKGIKLTGAASLLLGVGAVLLLRSMARDGRVPGLQIPKTNSYSWKPVLGDVAKFAGSIAVGFALIIPAVRIQTHLARTGAISDSMASVWVALAPTFAFMLLGFYFLLRAMARAIQGVSREEV